MLSGIQVDLLERIYLHFHHRHFLHPDPLSVLYRYKSTPDREIAGLIAAVLAYGRARVIEKNAHAVLDRIDPPFDFLMSCNRRVLAARLRGFRHRWTDAGHLVDLLWGMRGMIRETGSLGESFRRSISPGESDLIPALSRWVNDLIEAGGARSASLLADPRRGSACKRLHMYLRWMIRSDNIDPGLWSGIDPAGLIIPVDTHMHRVCRILGTTSRRSADLRTALEITEGFRAVRPEDPLRYDFSITRIGIRGDSAGMALMQELRDSSPDRQD